MSSWLSHVWWWIEVHTGTVNEPGPYYGFWSGFGSTIQQDVFLLAPFLLALRFVNCGTGGKWPRGCWRLGHHEWVDEQGVKHKLCKHHHPRVEGVLTHEHIQAVHDARESAPPQ